MRRAFTLIELLLVISVIAVLIALTLPALAKARAAGREQVCRANMRSLAGLAAAYSADHKGLISDDAIDLDIVYGPATICPSDPYRGMGPSGAGAGDDHMPFSYAFLFLGMDSMRTIIAIDAMTREESKFLSDDFIFRHGLRAGEQLDPNPFSAQWLKTWRNKAWLDGSVEARRGPTSTDYACWQP